MIEILKFYTKDCSPCKNLDRILEKYKIFKVTSVDIEKDAVLKEKYNIRSVPTIIYKDSKATGMPECAHFLELLAENPNKDITKEMLFTKAILRNYESR